MVGWCFGNIRFPGQYFDEETELHFNRFRYYDPEVGRYVSADPIGQFGGVNAYRYVRNDPLNGADPFGLFQVSPSVRASYPNVSSQIDSSGSRAGNSASSYPYWSATTGASGDDVNAAFTPGQGPAVSFGQTSDGTAKSNPGGSIVLDQDFLDRLERALEGPDAGFIDDPNAGTCRSLPGQGPSPGTVADVQADIDIALSHELAHILGARNGKEPPIGSQDSAREAIINLNRDIEINSGLTGPIFGRSRPRR